MKILFACYQYNSLGGLINWAEQLGYGFLELGHEVELVLLHPTSTSPYNGQLAPDSAIDPSVFPGAKWVDQRRGWLGARRFAYGTTAGVDAFRRYAETFDLLLVVNGVPTQSRATWGIGDAWLRIYDAIPTIILTQDGNLPRYYPHVVLAPATHIAAVHDCSYNNTAGTPFARRLILTPLTPLPCPRPWSTRARRWVAPHNFKAWKRMQDIVAAVPHADPRTKGIICGGGIEHNYLTSETKCKPAYYHNGERIWDVALQHGMRYAGFQSVKAVTALLGESRVMLDASYSRKYAATGAHYNRVLMEAMMTGCIPMARPSMTESRYFRVDQNHYMPLPVWGSEPAVFAAAVDAVLDLPASIANDIIQANWEYVTRHTTHHHIAGRFLRFSRAPPPNNPVTAPELLQRAEYIMEEHFQR